MKTVLEQFPKNKTITGLSIEQKTLRLNSVKKVYEYGIEIRCRSCGKYHETKEYYIKDKHTGRRSTKCRDCQMKDNGIIEIGKQRFAFKIADKGFRRCSVCKDIKPLNEYKKNAKRHLGISNTCYDCSKELHAEFQKDQHSIIGKSYIMAYGKLKGITVFNDDIINDLKSEIIKNREPKYFLNGKSFRNKTIFAEYVFSIYNISASCTIKRLDKGHSESECIIPSYFFRSIFSGTKK